MIKKNYNTENSNELELLEGFEEWIQDFDAVDYMDELHSYARDAVSVWTEDLFKNPLHLTDYIDKELEENGGTDIVKILQAAHYRKNVDTLKGNREVLVHNIAARYMMNNRLELTQGSFENALNTFISGEDISELWVAIQRAV